MNKESLLNKMKSAFENTIPTEIDYALNILHNAEAIMDGEKIVGKEGPSGAKGLLLDEHLTIEEIDRICYIIGHHHTFSAIDKNFKTESGHKLATKSLVVA